MIVQQLNMDSYLMLGTWSSPSITGTRPSPRSNFTLTSISPTHAVLFGGWNDSSRLNDTYLLDFSVMVSNFK